MCYLSTHKNTRDTNLKYLKKMNKINASELEKILEEALKQQEGIEYAAKDMDKHKDWIDDEDEDKDKDWIVVTLTIGIKNFIHFSNAGLHIDIVKTDLLRWVKFVIKNSTNSGIR